MIKILLMDDDVNSENSMVQFFNNQNFECTHLAYGFGVLERVKEFEPDIILCDYNLPPLSGLDILYQLKGDIATAPIPFVFMSGNAPVDDVIVGLKAGARAFLSKSMGLFDFIKGIGKWTAQYILMRTVKHPDAMPFSDLELLKAIGSDAKPGNEKHLRKI